MPQGGILRPTLFNLLVEQLVTLPFKPNTKLITYSDDLQLVATGPSRLTYAQHALDLITANCNTLGLKINPTKSVYSLHKTIQINNKLLPPSTLPRLTLQNGLHIFASGPHSSLQLKYIQQRTSSSFQNLRTEELIVHLVCFEK